MGRIEVETLLALPDEPLLLASLGSNSEGAEKNKDRQDGCVSKPRPHHATAAAALFALIGHRVFSTPSSSAKALRPRTLSPVEEKELDLSLLAMSFTLKASCRPVAAMAACRPVAAAGSARRFAPSAARLAPLRPASALKNASLTGLCSSFAGKEVMSYGLAWGSFCSSTLLSRRIGARHMLSLDA